jgi:prepilin-type N-terminal cleavage/methylation domain-containing protein
LTSPATPPRRDAGFTLIEVIGALVVFSVGLIMLLSITRGLSQRLEFAALNSLITAEGQERVDSLGTLAYASLALGTDTDTVSFRGVAYRRLQVVTQYTPLVRQAAVTIEPIDSVSAPTFAATVFVSDPW